MLSTNMFEHTKKFANVWLQRCRLQHQSCQVAETTFLPTRLIDVSLHKPPTPSLCLGENITSRAQYATLSHCWGDPASMSMKLELSTLESMMQVMDFDFLPKTFQDAIKVTQSLGIRYIWIDSLCIIQDSIDDWQNESAAMSHIFSNGVINICATEGKDSTKGLFYNRAAIATRPVHVQLSLRGKPAERDIFCEKEIWIDAVDEAPLNRRGWVLQERLLSRRNLCFGIEQLFWECCETTACEMFPDAVPEALLISQNKLALKSSFAKLTNDVAMSRRSQEFYRFWERLVQYYTSCQLSHSEDKLVALGGLASRVQELNGGQYMAGLWRDHIIYQLCWRVKSYLSIGQREPKSELYYVAPSWSWAACSHPVEIVFSRIDSNEVELMVDILDVHVNFVSANPYGQVKDGFLTLRSFLAELTLRGEGLWLYHGLYDIVGSDCEFSFKPCWDDPEATSEFSDGSAFYLLPIQAQQPDKELDTDRRWAWYMTGIIVASIAGTSPLKFRRVASFQRNGYEELKMIRAAFNHFDQYFKDCGLDLEASKSANGMTQYTITII